MLLFFQAINAKLCDEKYKHFQHVGEEKTADFYQLKNNRVLFDNKTSNYNILLILLMEQWIFPNIIYLRKLIHFIDWSFLVLFVPTKLLFFILIYMSIFWTLMLFMRLSYMSRYSTHSLKSPWIERKRFLRCDLKTVGKVSM